MAKTKAQEWDEKIAAGLEAEGLTPIRGKVKANLDSIHAIRFSKEEAQTVREAALDRGMNLSEFVRSAALEKARTSEHSDRQRDLEALFSHYEEMRRLVEQLQREGQLKVDAKTKKISLVGI